MSSSFALKTALRLIKRTQKDADILHIRIPIGFYIETINSILHITNIYKTNESFLYIFYEDDLFFVKETTLYRDDIAYDIVKEKLNIDISTFYDIIKELSNIDDIDNISEIMLKIK